MKVLRKVFLAIVYLVLFAPIVVMVFFSFNAERNTAVFYGFSLRWYETLFGDVRILAVLGNTLVISLAAACLATVLGVVAAYGIFRMKAGKLKGAVNTVTNIPLTNPDIITGVSLMLLFTFVGRLLGLGNILGAGTLLLAHIAFDLPYVILNVLPRLLQSDRSQYEAALDLGCTPSRAFWKIIFPGIVPGILSGFIMAFTLSLDDFIISYYTNGHYNILATSLYTAVKKPIAPTYYALYTLIFLTILILMLAVNILQLRSEKKKSANPRKTMRETLCFLLVAVLVVSVLAAMASGVKPRKLEELREKLNPVIENLEYYTNHDLAGTQLYVYNWGEYMDDGSGGEDSIDLNLAFEAITGIEVIYDTYDSNEAMYATLAGGGIAYDIIIPSDYMIERLIKEDRIQPLDFSKIPNFHYIDEQYLNPAYDPTGAYSVPYAGGYLGVIYNNTMVDEADVDGTWSLLWNDKYKGQILGIDNARDALGIAMYSLGIDVNTTNIADWDRAAEKLSKQVPLLQGWYMDQIFNKMEGENAAIAVYYAGDYLTMVDDMGDAGDHLSFYMPEEGTNIYFDAMCVCKDSPNYEAAMLYINFMLDPYIAWLNAEYICYTCPNTAVLENEEYSLRDEEVLYPEVGVKATYYQHLDEATVAYYEQLWNKIKSNG